MKTLIVTVLTVLAISPLASADSQTTQVTSEALYRVLYGMALKGNPSVTLKVDITSDLDVVTVAMTQGGNTITCTQSVTHTGDSEWFDCKTTDELGKSLRQ